MKKNLNFIVFICLMAALVWSGVARAAYTTSCVDVTSFNDTPGDKAISSPSEKPVPSQIGSTYAGTTNYYVFKFKNPTCTGVSGISSWGFTENEALGMTFSSPDGELPVYSLGVKGLGFAVSIADPNGPYQPLTDSPTLPLHKSATPPGAGKSIGARYNIYILTTGVLATGTYNIAGQDIGFVCISSTQTANTKDLCARISMAPFNITVNGGTCYVSPSSASQVVTMPSAGIADFSGVNTESPQRVSFQITTACTAGVALYATVSDANNPANTGDVLSPSARSTAEGVGIHVYYNGAASPLLLGPESSVAGNLNQFFIGGGVGTRVTEYTLPFVAKYVQTSAQITPGKVVANAVVTFSYQ